MREVAAAGLVLPRQILNLRRHIPLDFERLFGYGWKCIEAGLTAFSE
jgi:hypothetical protein